MTCEQLHHSSGQRGIPSIGNHPGQVRHISNDERRILSSEDRLEEEQRILVGGTNRGGLQPTILEVGPSGHHGIGQGTRRRQGTRGHQGVNAYAAIGVAQALDDGFLRGLQRIGILGAEIGWVGHQLGSHPKGILANPGGRIVHDRGGGRIVPGHGPVGGGYAVKPQGLDAGFSRGGSVADELTQTGQCRFQHGGLLNQEAIGRRANPTIRMVEGGDQRLHVVAVELCGRQRLGILVLDAPNAGEVVIPIRAGSRIAGAVTRTPGVIVDGDLIVEIDQIDGPVRTHAAVNGAEPIIGARQELGLLAAVFLAALVGRALGVEELMMEELAGGLAHEERIPLGGRPLGRPSAAVINCRARGCGPSAHPVDLHVRLTLLIEGRVDLVLLNDIEERLHAAHLSAGQNLFGNDHVADGLAAGGRREEDFVVGCDLTAPSIATPGGDLLDRRAVGFKAVNARGDVAEVLGSVARLHASAGVAHRSVNPAIHAPAEIANDRVGVEGAPAGIEGFDLVRPTVSIGVPNPQDVGSLSHDDAVFPEHQRGGQFQAVGKKGALVGHAVAVGVFQKGDAV